MLRPVRYRARWGAPTASLLAVLALQGWVASACLPAETRPEPGSVLMTAAPSAATRDGFETDDGWHVHFERVVTSLGNIFLLDDPDANGEITCNPYSQPNYERLFDFAAMAEEEKVGVAYGRGTCSVMYAFRGPSQEALVGAGASAEDVERMSQLGYDDWSDYSPISLFVVGTAQRGTNIKRFEWTFRRQYMLDQCPSDSDADAYMTVDELADGNELDLTIEVNAEELFRTSNEDAASTQFGLYALLDRDGDDVVTFEELDGFPAVNGPWISQGDATGGGPGWPETVLDSLYAFLLPRVTRIRGGGACHLAPRY